MKNTEIHDQINKLINENRKGIQVEDFKFPPIDVERLKVLEESLIKYFGGGIDRKIFIYPEENGGVQIEADIGPETDRYALSIVIDLDTLFGDLHVLHLKTDTVYQGVFDLKDGSHWNTICVLYDLFKSKTLE